jgi:integrase
LVGGQRHLLIGAVKSHVARHPVNLPAKPVDEAATELVARKKAQGMSERYLHDLRHRLGRFAQDFKVPLSAITTAQVQQWMDGLGLSAQSIRNYRTVLHVFFEYCATRGYIPPDTNPIRKTERMEIKDREVEIFSPWELAALLDAAEDSYRPCAALQGLAGLRSNEVERLEWRDIDLERRLIVISKGVAKTASRRTIPIGDSLAAWLSQAAQVGRNVWPGTHEEYYTTQNRSARNAGIDWKHNGLRHSYASYRFALVPDAGRVAAELGHSAAILHKHYREIARREEAERWFTVAPESVQVMAEEFRRRKAPRENDEGP